MNRRVISALVVGAFCLSACAEMNSIHRRVQLPYEDTTQASGEIISVDAKQRHLLISPELSTTREVQWRMCAEAAPDVFSAYAASGAAEGGSNGQSVSAKFGFSGSETAATIERTQSINLLRESMYRTCERFLSGAINRTMFITQAARDQRSMIAFLAIEQLTRAARPPAIVISGPATSVSIRDGEAAARMVEEFRTTAQTSQAAALAADTDLQTKNAGAKCLTQDAADTDDDPVKQAALSGAFAKCLAAKATKATKDAENKQAQERLDQALTLAADTVSTINAANEAGASSFGSGGAALSDAAVGAVSDAIVKIAVGANINEPLMFCIGFLSEQARERALAAAAPGVIGQPFSTTETTCLDIVTKRALIDDRLYADGLVTQVSYSAGPSTEALHEYLSSGTDAERAVKVARAREALRYFGKPSSRGAVVTLTAQDPVLQAAVLAFVKAKYPD